MEKGVVIGERDRLAKVSGKGTPKGTGVDTVWKSGVAKGKDDKGQLDNTELVSCLYGTIIFPDSQHFLL